MNIDRTALLARWQQLTATAGSPPVRQAVFDELIAAYTDAGRHYHNLEHIAGCLVELDSARQLAADAKAIESAIWFHDAVYNPRKPDNEERSADLAAASLTRLGAEASFRSSVAALILDTKHKSPPTTPDGQLIVDIDLAGLAAPAQEFDANTQKIRREFAHLSDEEFRDGRGKFLVQFLARPRIYYTGWYFQKCESAARKNLERAADRMNLRA